MARGGARAGAGRKPGPRKAPVVLGFDGKRLPPALAMVVPTLGPAVGVVPAELSGDVLAAPGWLSEAERAVWTAHAPLATAQGTLVPATVPGFAEFCRLMVHQAELGNRINELGRTSADADRLLKRWEKGVPLLTAKMKDYKLTAFGKREAAAEKPKAAVNPWSQVAQK